MGSKTDQKRIEIYKLIVEVDERLMSMIAEKELSKSMEHSNSVDKYKESLVVFNDKLDLVNDR